MSDPRTPALAELLGSLADGGPQARLGELLERLPIGIALLDGDDEALPVAYLNSRAAQLTSMEGDEALGQPLGTVLPGADRVVKAVREARDHAGLGQVRYRAAGGRLWDFEATRLGQGSGGRTTLLATWREAPGRVSDLEPGSNGAGSVRLYERAQNTARRLQVGVDVALEVATRLEPEEVVDRILHRALEAVDAERAMLGRMESSLRCTILGSVDVGGDPAPIGMTVSLESQEPAVEAITSRRPAQGRIDYEEIGMRPLRWALVIPLVVGGELIALLGVSRDRGQFDEEEIAVLQQIGAMAALAFRNATLFQTLREASRVRSQFLNMAAHELRTPLSVIGGYVSMLADGTLGEGPAAWKPPLEVLVEKTRELAHLIDDILLAGRLESGVARTTGRPMDLGETLRGAVQRAAARAELIEATVEVQTPPSLVPVSVDPDHIARILDNLVNNAFNYSPGPPRVSVTLETVGDAALLRVEDRGRGIGAEHRERIFQQFYRVDDPTDAYPPGTGLGLFISRALAERYGGRLELEWSEPGAGSRFLLRLPLARTA